MRKIVAVALVAWVTLAGCSAKKQLSAEEYFSQGEKRYREGAYPIAVENYRELLDQHPFSDYTADAELRIAHAHYLHGDYIESIAALTDFQRRHPTNPALPFVGYLLGMSYKRQMGTIDRDQTAARSAEAYFATVMQQYPESPFTELAQAELFDCQRNLAAKELYIAGFYSSYGNRQAAERRMLEVVGRYPYTELSSDALIELGKLYQKREEPEKAALAYATLLENYPRSSSAETARRALGALDAETGLAVGADPRAQLLAAGGYRGNAGSEQTVRVPGIGEDDEFTVPPIPSLGIPTGAAGSY